MIRRPTASVISYFQEKDIFDPDGIIIGEDLDVHARKETGEAYPFDEEFSGAGCYLIFDRVEPPTGESINSIYAGRSSDLSKRLRTHWCEDRNNIISSYHAECEQGKYAQRKLDGYSYDVLSVEPGAPTCFAIWLLDQERERMLFEHELIYKCKPLMNKA